MITVIDNDLITITINKKNMYKTDWEALQKYITQGIIGKARWDFYKPYFDKKAEDEKAQIEETTKKIIVVQGPIESSETNKSDTLKRLF